MVPAGDEKDGEAGVIPEGDEKGEADVISTGCRWLFLGERAGVIWGVNGKMIKF